VGELAFRGVVADVVTAGGDVDVDVNLEEA
jgi:hypothetical protein